MMKENIYTLMALTVIFALGCAVALETENPGHWYGFISAFATSIIAISTVFALVYWRKQERLKYKAQRAAEISLELSKPLWMLEITLFRYEMRKILYPQENHEAQLRSKLIENLEAIENKLHKSIAFKSQLVDQNFARFCSSWRLELLGFDSKPGLLKLADIVYTAFKRAQDQLIEISAIEREEFETVDLMPEDYDYFI